MAGELQLNSAATEVTSFPLCFVVADSGSFSSISAPALVNTMNITPSNPWIFSPPPGQAFSDLWSVGGFTFDFQSDTISKSGNILDISGLGTITGNGYDATSFDWNLYLDDPSQGVYNPCMDFNLAVAIGSTVDPVPDGGLTVAFLGLALAGVEGLRRKLAKKTS